MIQEIFPKPTWKQIINAIVQAAIAALTALGMASCQPIFFN